MDWFTWEAVAKLSVLIVLVAICIAFIWDEHQ